MNSNGRRNIIDIRRIRSAALGSAVIGHFSQSENTLTNLSLGILVDISHRIDNVLSRPSLNAAIKTDGQHAFSVSKDILIGVSALCSAF